MLIHVNTWIITILVSINETNMNEAASAQGKLTQITQAKHIKQPHSSTETIMCRPLMTSPRSEALRRSIKIT